MTVSILSVISEEAEANSPTYSRPINWVSVTARKPKRLVGLFRGTCLADIFGGLNDSTKRLAVMIFDSGHLDTALQVSTSYLLSGRGTSWLRSGAETARRMAASRVCGEVGQPAKIHFYQYRESLTWRG